jgi:predicted dehydrogenase
MPETIGIGIIGASGIAEHAHIPGYQNQPEARLVAVADVVPARATALAERFDIPHAYGSWEELLLNPDVEAVSVATPNAFHGPIAMAALNAGKHVFCEKPPATSAAEAARMKAVADISGKTLYFCFNNRFRPEVVQLKRYVDAGELGEVYYAKTATLRRRGGPGGWFADKKISGGGALVDIGVHCIDWTRYIMGKPKPIEVFGQTYAKIKTYDLDEHRTWLPAEFRGGQQPAPADRAGDVDEMATAMVRFDNGATLFAEVSWTLNVETDSEYTQIYGTRAGASFLPLKLFRNEFGRMVNLEVKLPDGRGPSGHSRAIRNFLDTIEGRAEPVVTPQDGVEIMQILDAVYESTTTGKSVAIPAAEAVAVG